MRVFEQEITLRKQEKHIFHIVPWQENPLDKHIRLDTNLQTLVISKSQPY